MSRDVAVAEAVARCDCRGMWLSRRQLRVAVAFFRHNCCFVVENKGKNAINGLQMENFFILEPIFTDKLMYNYAIWCEIG